MSFAGIRRLIRERLITSGLSPSRRIGVLNLFFEFGQWLRDNERFVKLETRYDLYEHINREILKNAPIDYLEFGVAEGESMRDWLQLNQHQASRFFGFDTFEGLPEPWKKFRKTYPKGSWSTEGRIPELNDSRVIFTKGLFQATLPTFLKDFAPHNRLVINCDADLYNSTLYVLASLNNLISPGTIVLLDEFSTMEEFRAFRDFTQSFRRTYKAFATAERFYLKMAVEFL